MNEQETTGTNKAVTAHTVVPHCCKLIKKGSNSRVVDQPKWMSVVPSIKHGCRRLTMLRKDAVL